MPTNPLITIVVPSYNQGKFLNQALESIVSQNLPIEIFVMDGGSTDNSIDIIKHWEKYLSGWRSYADSGQAAAINEGIAQGSAPFVCWLNSDDWLLPNGLNILLETLKKYPEAPAAYGNAWNFLESKQSSTPVLVEPFNEHRLAMRCIISQPATLIRRTAWEQINGLNSSLHMTMDYDLWWRLFKNIGPIIWTDNFIAVNREHALTKTTTKRRLHYQEAMAVVKTHYGKIPIKWWLYQPYAVWYKTIRAKYTLQGI